MITSIQKRLGVKEVKQEECPSHGKYEAVLTAHSDKWLGCPHCAAEGHTKQVMADRAREQEEREIKSIELFLGRSAIPKRFQGKSLENYEVETEPQRRALAACVDYAASFPARMEDGRCLLLLGKPGTGKTHLAAAIASEVIKRHRMPAMYSTISEAVRRFKDNWTTKLMPESHLIQFYAKPALLVLDEVGHGWGSDTELMYLFEIVNARYQDKKPTVFAGNIEKADVRNSLGDRVADRLNEAGGRAVIFNWGSHRGKV